MATSSDSIIKPGLVKGLGLLDATTIVMGSMIASRDGSNSRMGYASGGRGDPVFMSSNDYFEQHQHQRGQDDDERQ